jgi:surface antigen
MHGIVVRSRRMAGLAALGLTLAAVGAVGEAQAFLRLLAPVVAGSVAGGIVAGLTIEEKRAMEEATSQAAARAEVGQTVKWSYTDPKSKKVTATGAVTVKSKVYQTPKKQTCRDVTELVAKNGNAKTKNVHVCQQPVPKGVTVTANTTSWVITEL